MTDRTAVRQSHADPGPVLDVLLRHGGMAQVRPVGSTDEAALRALNDRVSMRTKMLRYFSVSDRPGDWYVDHVLRTARTGDALAGLVGGQIVALASFSRLESDPDVADVALLVDDAHQAEGLGALLLEHLAQHARRQGIRAFVADVLLENTGMMQLLADSGFATRTQDEAGGVRELYVDLTAGPRLEDAVHRREMEAERASLRPVLAPRSIAVVGSARPGSIAEQVHGALRAAGFTGTLHRVDRHSTLSRMGEPVDLVIVAVPSATTLGVARDAAAAGAKGLLVLSAGFAESGPEGLRQQLVLLDICRRAGMRLVGPNCLGLVNTDPEVRLNATFCDARPRPGGVALISQSGAVGIAALRHAERRGAGLSLFVSTGNKADVSGNDLLAYLEEDPRTKVIALYLESFGNARKFGRLAATVGRSKPIVVVKAGRSEVGTRTGQPLPDTAASDVAIDALLHRAGVVRTGDLPELFDVLALFECAPLPRGNRVAVIGNSGGPGVLAIDACRGTGLEVATLSATTREQLRHLLPAGATLVNPVSLLATVGVEDFEQAVALVAQDPGVDAVISIYTPLLRGAEDDYAAALTRVHAQLPDVPLITTFPGVAWPPPSLQDPTGSPALPFFEFPEPAVRALGRVAAYATWRATPPSAPPPPSPPQATAQARALIGDVTDEHWLSPSTATALLESYGIPTARVLEVLDAAAAEAAADSLGYPVALKAVGPSLAHKTDKGAVLLGLSTPDQVQSAFASLQHHLGPTMTSAVVQGIHPTGGGLELFASLTVDPQVGRLLLVGAGGVLTDLLDDHLVRVPPRTVDAALEQLNGLRCARRFAGHRSLPALDVHAAALAMVAIGRLARDLTEIRELDINPLLLTPTGICCLDVRIKVGPARDSGWHDATTRTLTRPPA